MDEEIDQNLSHKLVVQSSTCTMTMDGLLVIGVASWFNVKLQNLRLSFDNGSDDYISINEIDGVEIKHI